MIPRGIEPLSANWKYADLTDSRRNLFIMVEPGGFEPLPLRHDLQSCCYIQIAFSLHFGTYVRNRTPVNGFGIRCSTIELHRYIGRVTWNRARLFEVMSFNCHLNLRDGWDIRARTWNSWVKVSCVAITLYLNIGCSGLELNQRCPGYEPRLRPSLPAYMVENMSNDLILPRCKRRVRPIRIPHWL